jgi:hypothetical protein
MKCHKCGGTRWVKKGTTGRGHQRFQCKTCGYRPWSTHIKPDAGIPKAAVRALHKRLVSARGVQRYVITAAQNATPVNQEFLGALFTLCRERKAQLIVIPYRYHNPTSMWGVQAKSQDWWASELLPYIYDRRRALNKNLLLLGDIMTQPTASRPLEGFESISGSYSAIIGHPKLELTTVPTPQNRLPKILTTTGAVTQKNYIPSKAGKKGEFHHTYGAAYVEVKGSKFHLRQLNAVKDGSFIDLGWEYRSNAEPKWVGVSGIVLGDEHEEFMDPAVRRATFGPQGIVTVLRPKIIVRHDVHDFYSRTHWHTGEAFIDFVKHHTGTDDVEKSLRKTAAYIDATTPAWARNVLVYSNHPDMLARWVKRAMWQSDPRNAKFLLKTALAMVEGAYMSETGARTIDPFAHWMKQWLVCQDRTTFLDRNESFQIEGIECGYHGDYGLNGARGSRQGFTKIGTKVVIGHGHSPGICEGAYQGGTMARLGLEFVRGPSSWLATDTLIYPNGKRSLINIVDGEWRA